MSARRFSILVALLTLSAACQSTVTATSAPRPERTVLTDFLPPAKHALEVQGGLETSLDQLIGMLAEATGIQFAIDPTTRAELQKTSAGLSSPISVPPDEAWRWVEGLLVHTRFQLGMISNRPPQLLGVYSTPRQNEQPRPRPVFIGEGELALCIEHPAFLYSVVLDLPHVDVRQLGNSLRGLGADPSGAQSVIPVGNTNSVILTGAGGDVATLAAMMRQVEEAARKLYEKAPGSNPGVGPAGNPVPPPGGGG
jgi:hypothetical protein